MTNTRWSRILAKGWEQLFQGSGARHTRMMTRGFRPEDPDRLEARFPGNGPRLAASRQYRKELHLREVEPLVTVVAWLSVVAALASGAGWIVARRRGTPWPATRSRVAAAGLVLVVAYVAHAFSIGTSHYPVERYGARVQWLLALAPWMWALRVAVDVRGAPSGRTA